jgi:hypothetical protein
MEEVGNAYTILVGKPEGKRPLDRPRRGWEDFFKEIMTVWAVSTGSSKGA